MYRYKKLLIVCSLLLSIGFAAVSTTLYLNGTVGVIGDTEGFEEEVIFTSTNTNKGTSEISNNGKTIDYISSTLTKVDETSYLNFEITNYSSNYDAEAKIICSLRDEDKIYDDYVSYRPNENTYIIPSKQSINGYITVALRQLVAEEKQMTFSCEMKVKAVERTEIDSTIISNNECLSIEYNDKKEINLLSDEKMELSDVVNLPGTKITVRNNCSTYVSYDLMLEKYDNTNISDEKVFARIEKGKYPVYNGLISNAKKENKYELYSFLLEPSSSEEFNFKFFLNEEVSENKPAYSAKLVVNEEKQDDLFANSKNIISYTSNSYFWQSMYKYQITSIEIKNSMEGISDYTDSWDVSIENDGSVMAYIVGDKLIIEADGGINMPSNCNNYFQMPLVSEIKGIEYLKFDNVTTMNSMFSSFGQASSNDVRIDLGLANLSNVEETEYAFENVGKNPPISVYIHFGNNANMDSLENASYMFSYVGGTGEETVIDLGNNFNASILDDASYMLYYAGRNSKITTIDLGNNFNINNASKLNDMFYYVGDASEYVYINLGDNFNCNNATSAYEMFKFVGKASKKMVIDLGSNFNAIKLSDASRMFYGVGFSSLDVKIDFGKKSGLNALTKTAEMFRSASNNGKKIVVKFDDDFDVSNVTNMSSMFELCGETATEIDIDVTNFNTNSATNMGNMFYSFGTKASYKYDLSSWNVSNVTNHSLFSYGTNGKIIEPNWN